jgi:hypothetical protein
MVASHAKHASPVDRSYIFHKRIYHPSCADQRAGSQRPEIGMTDGVRSYLPRRGIEIRPRKMLWPQIASCDRVSPIASASSVQILGARVNRLSVWRAERFCPTDGIASNRTHNPNAPTRLTAHLLPNMSHDSVTICHLGTGAATRCSDSVSRYRSGCGSDHRGGPTLQFH